MIRPEPAGLLWFFMLQRYEQHGVWVDVSTRYVELKPRRDGQESDPVAAYCVRHIKACKDGPFRVKVKEIEGGVLRRLFVVHIDGTRTPIND
ncbi:hypothetical protein [Streptomyces werraensis]|uniref:hypothetical protein n=1 Tax=Streptomyces werraensis TaxID=68284 RepID=UPI003418AD65